MSEPKLEYYTVVSVHIETGRLHTANILAVSAKDSLRLELMSFGEPIFRVLRAYKKISK